MTGYLLIAFMAALNACMDAWENSPNFNESIFKSWDKRFWCKDVSWEYAKKIFGYHVDSWHLVKTLFIICLAMIPNVEFKGSWWVVAFNICVIWNMVFVLFYHHIFKIK